MSDLLNHKTALVFGASGHVGKAVARAFVAHGASVHASARATGTLEDIDGLASVSTLDALDEDAVQAYVDGVAERAGSIDIAVNLAATDPAEYGHGAPAETVSLDQFLIPQKTATATQFVTAKAAYRQMRTRNSGVIILVTSSLAKVGSPWSPALSASHAATEGLMRSLAHEWGPEGIRVLGVRSEAMPASPAIHHTFSAMGANIGLSKDEMEGFVAQNKTALKRLPSAEETAQVITLAASDMAGYMTGAILNHSGGHILD